MTHRGDRLKTLSQEHSTLFSSTSKLWKRQSCNKLGVWQGNLYIDAAGNTKSIVNFKVSILDRFVCWKRFRKFPNCLYILDKIVS